MLFNLTLGEEIKIVEALLKEKHKFQNSRYFHILYDKNTNFFNVGTFYFGYIMGTKDIRGTDKILDYLEKMLSEYHKMDRPQFILTYGKFPFDFSNFLNGLLASGSFSEIELKEFVDKIIK